MANIFTHLVLMAMILLLTNVVKRLDARVREQDEEIYKLKQRIEELDYRTRR